MLRGAATELAASREVLPPYCLGVGVSAAEFLFLNLLAGCFNQSEVGGILGVGVTGSISSTLRHSPAQV